MLTSYDDIKQVSSIDEHTIMKRASRMDALTLNSYTRKITYPTKETTYKSFIFLKGIILISKLYFRALIRNRYVGMIYLQIKMILAFILYMYSLITYLKKKHYKVLPEMVITTLFVMQLIASTIVNTVYKIKNEHINKIKKAIIYIQIVHIMTVATSILYFVRDTLKYGPTNVTTFAICITLYLFVEISFLSLLAIIVAILIFAIAFEKLIECAKKKLLKSKGAQHFVIHSYIYNDRIGQGECLICLEGLRNGENISILKCICEGMYHTMCIVSWHLKSRNCPLCRKEVGIF